KLKTTSSAVQGSPLWNFSPGRSLNSYVRPSGLSLHDSARAGPIRSPGSGRTTASWSAYRMPKGVIWAGVSAGSNQLGLSVTGMAYTSSPAGVDCARAFWRSPAVHISILMSRNIRCFISISLGRYAALTMRPDCLVLRTAIASPVWRGGTCCFCMRYRSENPGVISATKHLAPGAEARPPGLTDVGKQDWCDYLLAMGTCVGFHGLDHHAPCKGWNGFETLARCLFPP